MKEITGGVNNLELGVSVIICCYNSAERLPATLEHLALQLVAADISWEILVIDNASTDRTNEKAIEEWEKHNRSEINFRVLRQPLAGKNYAYQMGVCNARYEYLLTCDDDNWLHADYIATAFEIMQSDKNIGVLGGCGVFNAESPLWPEIHQYKAAYINGPQPYAATEHWVYGAGSVCRQSVIRGFYKQGWPQIISGMLNGKIMPGEDIEICFIHYLAGYKIIAHDQLLFKHFVPLRRQCYQYLFDLKFRQSFSYVLLSSYIMLIDQDKRPVRQQLNDALIHTTKAAILLIKKLAITKYVKWQRADADIKLTLRGYLGTINSILKNGKKVHGHHHQLKKFLKDQRISIIK